MESISRTTLKNWTRKQLLDQARTMGHRNPESRNCHQLRAWIHGQSYRMDKQKRQSDYEKRQNDYAAATFEIVALACGLNRTQTDRMTSQVLGTDHCTCIYDPETGVAEYTRPGCPMHDPNDAERGNTQ